jgi:hypothetical protein
MLARVCARASHGRHRGCAPLGWARPDEAHALLRDLASDAMAVSPTVRMADASAQAMAGAIPG